MGWRDGHEWMQDTRERGSGAEESAGVETRRGREAAPKNVARAWGAACDAWDTVGAAGIGWAHCRTIKGPGRVSERAMDMETSLHARRFRVVERGC